MSGPLVVALDLSLTCTGVVDEAGVPSVIEPVSDRLEAHGTARMVEIRDRVLSIVPPKVDLVIMEDLAYAAKGRGRDLAGLAHVVRAGLWDRDVEFVAIAPGQLKKYATGTGKASKEQVLTAAIHRIGYRGHSTDEADAMWLWAIGHDLLGHATTWVPKANREWLEKLR